MSDALADFAILILSHGRADNVRTVEKLAEFKYTGRFFVVVDDEDDQVDANRKRYSDKVVVFSKREAEKITDAGDNLESRSGVVYARNYAWTIARKLGLRYFMAMDDDYTGFYVRLRAGQGSNDSGAYRAECLDGVLAAMLRYFKTTPALAIAMSQGGDHIGGTTRNNMQKRKAMNTFLCAVDRPFKFYGRLNEDTTAYTLLGRRGALFLTIPNIQVNQLQTQANPGGLTEQYLDVGTYVKSFYSVLYTPSAVRDGQFKDARSDRLPRVHHAINWKATVAQILPERFRKPDEKPTRKRGGAALRA